MAEHLIAADAPTHRRWDVDLQPVVEIDPGDEVVVETVDFAAGQITRQSSAEDLLALDFERIYPLAGPIAVRGAQPGDALAVHVLSFQLPEWGWACIIPGLGLLEREEFPSPALRIFDLTTGDWTQLCPGVRIPIAPFLGTIGVPGAGMRQVPIPPPHHGGGNIDIRHITAGSTVYLPVSVPGGLLSMGDAHAAQGDGEVAISGIECAMRTRLRVELVRDARLPAPQLRRPAGSLTAAVDHGGWYATFGVEEDLMQASRAAVRAMVDHLGRERGLGREDAYILCSLAGDLKICEIVDSPRWIVGCFMPDAVFS
ncbi:MAG TPA: acetamidase/formamidase family protein [Solirubrobacteraceae bacterium]|nr:acetamidase/formamidase family protein [Solirubrobacteraceae bacterium]